MISWHCIVAHQQEKLRAMRAMSEAEDVHLVINARTDPYLVNNDGAENLRSAIERGNAYKAAGADCVFAPTWAISTSQLSQHS